MENKPQAASGKNTTLRPRRCQNTVKFLLGLEPARQSDQPKASWEKLVCQTWELIIRLTAEGIDCDSRAEVASSSQLRLK